MEPKYIFIVGLPRTGTKLMMNLLENYQEKRCYITVENFFLGRFLKPGVRQKIKHFGTMSQDTNVKNLVDAMYNGQFFGEYWKKLANGQLNVDKNLMLQALLRSDRSDKAIYSTLLRIHTGVPNDNLENVIFGDKSGPHLYYVPVLLEWFPEAKVVHTFRDPRAVLASEHKKLLNKMDRQIKKAKSLQALLLKLIKPFYSIIIVLYITTTWLYAARLHARYKQKYPTQYYLSKFEDLITQPEKSVRKLCQFLEIEFHPDMLEPPKIDSSYAKTSGTGFDTQTLNRWQFYLQPWMSGWLLFWGKKYLKEFNYIQ